MTVNLTLPDLVVTTSDKGGGYVAFGGKSPSETCLATVETKTVMQTKRIRPDEHLIFAGECFMYLCWVESTMRDFVVLREGDEDMRRRYNEAHGKENHPPDFARKRLELGCLDFGDLKERFLRLWPKWKESHNIHGAIECAVIYRNGFGHAQVQPFRQYLLYTPNKYSLKKINNYMTCPNCTKLDKDCMCEQDNRAEPYTLMFKCLDDKFRANFYGNIKIIDLYCFTPTAKLLDVAYQGVAWPQGNEYVIGGHHLLPRQ